MEKYNATVSIKGMSRPHYVAPSQKALEGIPGISNVEVNLDKGEAGYEGEVDKGVIKEAISKNGFEVLD